MVPIYPTNAPEECEWVISDSAAIAIVAEDEDQLEKLVEIREKVPNLRTVILIDAADAGCESARALGAVTLDEVRERGRARSLEELTARREAVKLEDPYTFIYTSGTTGPPKGCVLTHGNYRSVVDMVDNAAELEGEETIYLYLPLAHAYALLIQLLSLHLGATLAYFGGDTKQIVPEMMEVKPTYLPSVPRIFEKIYTLARGAIDAKPPEERKAADEAIALGVKVRKMIAAGEEVPEQLRVPFEKADEELFANVRAIFGGRCKRATSGAAPIAREILEFFFACGIVVLEGYGMTETATAATFSTRARIPLRHGRPRSAGRADPDRR